MQAKFQSVLSDKGYDILAKILVSGDVAVGKTSIIKRYFDGVFDPETLTTTALDFKFKDLIYEGSRVRLQIWDTVGQQRYRTITRSYYSGASGIILAYSVTDRSSFESIEAWMKDLKDNSNAVIVLVANKTDCEKSERQVTTHQGEALARTHDVNYFEASAKTGHNIDKVFDHLVGRAKVEFGLNQSVSSSRLIMPTIKKEERCAC